MADGFGYAPHVEWPFGVALLASRPWGPRPPLALRCAAGALAPARFRGSPRRAVPGLSCLARHPCLAPPSTAPALGLRAYWAGTPRPARKQGAEIAVKRIGQLVVLSHYPTFSILPLRLRKLLLLRSASVAPNASRQICAVVREEDYASRFRSALHSSSERSER